MDAKFNNFEKGWANIHKSISKLNRLVEGLREPSFTTEEYTTSYTNVYNICHQRPPNISDVRLLYHKYGDEYKAYIATTVLPLLEEKQGEFLLKELVHRWANYKVKIRWLTHFFNYLDRCYAKREKLPTLREVGIMCFREIVYAKLNARVIDVMIDLIERERDGEQVDRTLLKNVVDMFVEMDTGEQLEYYRRDFEVAMLEGTGKYYSRKASSWILENSCPDYVGKVEKSLKIERERVSHYMHSTSEQKVVARVQLELLAVYKTQLLEKEDSGFLALLHDHNVEDLSRVFRIYLEIPEGLDLGANIFKQLITSEGTALVEQVENALTSIVTEIIELHNKYMAYVNGCFENHDFFKRAIKEAFEVFCNKDVAGTSFAELLSMFCDEMLREGGASEKLSDEAVEENLEAVTKLLEYVSDKDLFMEFYKTKLSHRLLFGKSANQEYEKCILTKLKQHHGIEFTRKTEKMIIDIELSKERHENFKKYLQDHPDVTTRGIDLNVTVLTAISWPNFNSVELNLPDEMLKCIDAFTGFYNEKTQNRRLTWVHSQGTCNIQGMFEAKTIELNVTTCQAAVLLLFNSADKLSYSEIMTRLNINDDELVPRLYSLSCSKHKILKKTPNTATVSPNDSFEFNSKFTDKLRKIRITPPMQVAVAVAEEKKKVLEDVDRDRRYAVDAAIVRIMKSRKVVSFQQLIIECVELLSPKFKPDIQVIKKRIEDLITRDYLERDEDDPNMFTYIA
ncbi:hypothetical protein TIFTF001_012415 [Ficus carica]|uniref:Cullin family profile domain-containing protein n=1 Tax=Ficus carica TaxID=3494 RepID=A0AA88DI26_FICCA|nr:hypothetical protein TIFTF001_012415 [Ficus carica]